MKIFPNGEKNNNTCRIPLTKEEREFCESQGIRPNMSEITWRVFRIMAEIVEGFQFLSNFKNEVTVFGSARFPPENKWYQEARKMGKYLADNGFTVVTGGGPGIMEAANRGAYEAGGESVGINIQLPMEQRINPYVQKSRAFHYFFTRKLALAASAQAYVYFPGGFGTMDEFFEILTLIQTEKTQNIPVICVGKEYWDPLFEWIKSDMYGIFDAISSEDMDLFKIVDTAEEAIELVKKTEPRPFF